MNNKKIDDKKQKQDKKKIHYANYENKIIYPNNKRIRSDINKKTKEEIENNDNLVNSNIEMNDKQEFNKNSSLDNSLDNSLNNSLNNSSDNNLNKILDNGSNDNANDNLDGSKSLNSDSKKTKNKEVIEAKYLKLSPREVLWYNNLNKYFSELDEPNFILMITIINSHDKKLKYPISLRLLDWFITKYAEKYKTKCTKKNGEEFVIHVSYKASLKTYKKINFDPFKRRQKFVYTRNKNGTEYTINTTLGQLHFFKWLFENNIMSYISDNLETLKADHEYFNREEKKRKLEEKNTKQKSSNSSKSNSSIEIYTSSSSDRSSLILSFD
ncbi:hypothetical protein Hokovirus_3_171 [Hokovirus HKV1]|uniref:Uncharacterized protein n=1 Tax=Hokovirus HKV1 TaxID=1977638 RepID=A0A1V0SGY3_9VIRU|nr:hypothetical protein Hokovirus_3_171 [Hokovirus HKV1]